jgi:hypothetical protein
MVWRMVLRRLRWVASQIGAKGSGRLLDPGEVLVRLTDLPGGWKQMDERRWRTGRTGGAESWVVRARELGGVTAWRSFAKDTGELWLWAQATPLAGEADAVSALDGVWKRAFRNLRARVEVVGTREGPDLHLPDGRAVTLEQQTRGREGDGVTRYLAWSCRGTVSVISGSGMGSAWDWPELESLASTQSGRIRDASGSPET